MELLNCCRALAERYGAAMDITRHRQIHHTFAHAQQPISELDKMKYLCEALEHDPGVQTCIQLYFTATPALEAQNFSNLATQVQNFIANRSASSQNK
jgi:hypothetical protein